MAYRIPRGDWWVVDWAGGWARGRERSERRRGKGGGWEREEKEVKEEKRRSEGVRIGETGWSRFVFL